MALFVDEACIESNVIFLCSQCGAQLSQSRAGGGALVRSGLQRLESKEERTELKLAGICT